MAINGGDVIRVTCKFSISGQGIQNVFHMRHTGTTTVDDADMVSAARTHISNAWTWLNDFIGNGLSYETIEFFSITQDAPIDEVGWVTLTNGSDGTDEEYALQVAPLVRFATGVARSQGRKFLGGFTEGHIGNGGACTANLLTAMGNWAQDFIDGFAVDGQVFKFGNWNPTLSRFATWISILLNTYAATQRRRRVGVGS